MEILIFIFCGYITRHKQYALLNSTIHNLLLILFFSISSCPNHVLGKELSFCNRFKFSNSNMCMIWWCTCKSVIFQTQIISWSNRVYILKYLRFYCIFGFKDIKKIRVCGKKFSSYCQNHNCLLNALTTKIS